MSSDVFWVDLTRSSFDNSASHKLRRVVAESGAAAALARDMLVALKVNTSEDGYDYGLRPQLIRALTAAIEEATGRRPTVCDGLRLVDYWNAGKGHSFLHVARSKGYGSDTLGGHFAINGGFSGDEGNLYSCGRVDATLGGVEVGSSVCRSDALWVFSHVTLHPLFGLAGALWNGGFECLIGRERGRVLEGLNPYAFNGATPPVEALRRMRRRALESHLGVRASVEGRVAYVSALWDVTPQPDYFPFSDGPVVENLGFLASSDPVALDAATAEVLAAASPRARDLARGFDDVLLAAESLGLGSARPHIQRLS